MQEIVIVNEDDKIIGFKNRKKLCTSDIYRVSALWIVNDHGQILLSQRDVHKKIDPGKWGPAVSGTIEKGEGYLQNIIKETREEIGIDLVKYAFKEIDKIHTVLEYNFFCQWYLLRQNIKIDDLMRQKNEVMDIKWFDKNEFSDNLKKYPEKYTIDMLHHYEFLKKY